MRIGYVTEDPGPAYAKALRGAATKDTLLAALSGYKRVAADAIAIVTAMTPATFKEFRAGLAKEQRGKFAGDEWAAKYGAVVMPEVMFNVSLVAQHFKAPWGCAFIRMCDVGHIAETGGAARMTEKWAQRFASAASPEAGPPADAPTGEPR